MATWFWAVDDRGDVFSGGCFFPCFVHGFEMVEGFVFCCYFRILGVRGLVLISFLSFPFLLWLVGGGCCGILCCLRCAHYRHSSSLQGQYASFNPSILRPLQNLPFVSYLPVFFWLVPSLILPTHAHHIAYSIYLSAIYHLLINPFAQPKTILFFPHPLTSFPPYFLRLPYPCTVIITPALSSRHCLFFSLLSSSFGVFCTYIIAALDISFWYISSKQCNHGFLFSPSSTPLLILTLSRNKKKVEHVVY